MAKFSGPSVRPGEQYVAPTPVEQIQEQTPQAEPVSDPLLNQAIAQEAEAAPAAPVEAQPVDLSGIATDQAAIDQEYARQEQIEQERVPSIAERKQPGFQPHQRWEIDQEKVAPPADPKVDGGLNARSNKLGQAFQTGQVRLPSNADKSVVAAATSKIGVTPENLGQFGKLSSLVTENILADLGTAATPDYEPGDNKTLLERTTEATFQPDSDIDFNKTAFTRDEGNAKLGKEIAREWQRYQADVLGQPTHEWTDISQDEARVLGDAVKTLWAKQNPDLVKRVPDASGRIYYQLTPQGVQDLGNGRRERARLFPKQHVRPSKVKPEKGQLIGEAGRLARRSSGEVGKQRGKRVIEEAMENLSQVPNVVDAQRHKIALATILPALGAQMDLDPEVAEVFADIHSVGQDKLGEFAAAYDLAQNDPDADADPPEVAMQKYKKNVAQGVMATAMERNGANYLTYYMQAFNGRIAPQQSALDPTTSKYVRFATRNAVPAKATHGSRVEKNLEQMYAMMLVKGADSLLPEGRVAALKREGPQLAAWGRRLQTLLDAIPDADVEAVADAIAQGIAVNNPNFPQLPALKLDPAQDADLIKAIASKGEDGPHFIDGLVDYAKFHKWQKDFGLNNRPFFSYFNAYMDGKTNGIASNGLQMGDKNIAFATGVLRKNDKELLDDGDVRDQLKRDLLEGIDNNGWHGLEDKNLQDPMNYVAKVLYSTRDLNKATTMTFGYGKELHNFEHDLREFAAKLRQTDPVFAESWKLLDKHLGEGEVVQALLNQYVISLGNVLSRDSFESRALMQNAALMAAMLDQPLRIRSVTGFELMYGGTEFRESSDSETITYSHYETVDGEEVRSRETLQSHPTKVTAGAVDNKRGVGGKAYGGSIPGPIQSLDAATVALTASGRSWDKMKKASNGNPYLHTIYDAFKVDAMGYDVALEEINRNWLNAGLNWSYLEETKKSLMEQAKEENEQYQKLTDAQKHTPHSAEPGGPYAMIGELYFKKPNREGKMTQGSMWSKMFKFHPIMEKSQDPQVQMEAIGESIKRINDVMQKAGVRSDADVKALTPAQAKLFRQMWAKEINFVPRLSALIEKTNNKKAELRKEIMKNPQAVYQYYAH